MNKVYSNHNYKSFKEFNDACKKEVRHIVPTEVRNNPLYRVYKRFGAVGERYAEYVIRGGIENPEERAALFSEVETR